MRFITKLGAAAAVTLALGWTTACSRPEVDPSEQANKALKDANFHSAKVDWDKDAKIAHLKGSVDQPPDRRKAEDVAIAAVGTSGRVLNELTINGVNDSTAGDLDRDIRTHLKDAMSADQVLRDRDIDFDVNNGVVTIKGEVRSADEKGKVTEIVRAAPGVKDMANALEIKPKK